METGEGRGRRRSMVGGKGRTGRSVKTGEGVWQELCGGCM